MKKNIQNLSVIWISRISDTEDNMLRNFFEKDDTEYEYERILVGHTNLNPDVYKFKYIRL